MARGWHYAKLSLSNAPRLSFSGLCILLFLFLSLCRFFCMFVFLFCSHWSLVDVSLIFSCPADHVPDWQPRAVLGMVEARSVNVKKTTTTTVLLYFVFIVLVRACRVGICCSVFILLLYRFSLSMDMSRLTRDGTAEPLLRDQILRRDRGQGNIDFSCSADQHVQEWQPYVPG